MKSFIFSFLILCSIVTFGQNTSDKTQIEATLNNYIDAFYKGDTTKLKTAIKPRLNKFGYWKDKESGNYEFYASMSYDKAMEFVTKMKAEGRTRDENTIRHVEVLDIGNHIASGKVTASWGIDYVLLSKDNGKWMIEQVIWEGPYQKENTTEQTTTLYFIRHAEKDRSDKTNRNPHLTAAGIDRANNWKNILKHVKFDMVYSTDYYRTKETALPTAKDNNLKVSLYDPRSIKGEAFIEAHRGKTILIVGHSNTTPMFVNTIIGETKYKDIEDSNNGNLYIVTMSADKTSDQLLVFN